MALLEKIGLDALSTRALAQPLWVKQPALYWQFKSRRKLLDAMNDRMLALAAKISISGGVFNTTT